MAATLRCFQPPLLLLLTSAITRAEMMTSLSDCDHFLLGGRPPQVPGVLEDGKILNQSRYKPICQTYQNQRKFLTLYDVRSRIPVFSACVFEGGQGRRPKTNWKMEPQLEDESADKNMKPDKRDQLYRNQAANVDYKNNGRFDRGHVCPSSYGSTVADKRATFTLTNVVPQESSFNQGSWNRMERCVACVMEKFCRSANGTIRGFVVTGAQPGPGHLLNSRVSVPWLMWSAFCCRGAGADAWLAGAHWGENVREAKGKRLQTKTLAQLHHMLGTNASTFNVFPGEKRCPLHTTAAWSRVLECDCPAPDAAAPRVDDCRG